MSDRNDECAADMFICPVSSGYHDFLGCLGTPEFLECPFFRLIMISIFSQIPRYPRFFHVSRFSNIITFRDFWVPPLFRMWFFRALDLLRTSGTSQYDFRWPCFLPSCWYRPLIDFSSIWDHIGSNLGQLDLQNCPRKSKTNLLKKNHIENRRGIRKILKNQNIPDKR